MFLGQYSPAEDKNGREVIVPFPVGDQDKLYSVQIHLLFVGTQNSINIIAFLNSSLKVRVEGLCCELKYLGMFDDWKKKKNSTNR